MVNILEDVNEEGLTTLAALEDQDGTFFGSFDKSVSYRTAGQN